MSLKSQGDYSSIFTVHQTNNCFGIITREVILKEIGNELF